MNSLPTPTRFSTHAPDSHEKSADTILHWLVERVAEILDIADHEIDPQAPHAEHGMDSMSAAFLAAELEDWLGISVSSSITWDHPTLDSLAQYLANTVRD